MADNSNMDYGSGVHVSPSSGGVVTGGDRDGPLPGGDLVSSSSGGIVTGGNDIANPSF